MLRVFIGYDPHETINYNVLCHSIWERASEPVAIIPLRKEQLNNWSGDHELAATEFSFSRFLVPYLCNYQGDALFIDCDMLVMEDICQIRDSFNIKHALCVPKQDYNPSTRTKFLGQVQSVYPPLADGKTRKNWSAVMYFNCAHLSCKTLTPSFIDASVPGRGLDLHQFKWCNDDEIGELSLKWNCLIGEENQVPPEEAALIHWTIGGPFFDEYQETICKEQFWNEVESMVSHAEADGIRRYRQVTKKGEPRSD